MRSTVVLAALVASAPVAAAAEPAVAAAEPAVLLAARWPSVPDGHGLSLEDQITERITWFGNAIGRHLDLLSHDTFQLTVDAHRRRAHLRIGGGDARLLSVRIDGDIEFDDANARIDARIDLALHGHAVHLALPRFEMSPAAYRGDYGVEVRLPLLVQRF